MDEENELFSTSSHSPSLVLPLLDNLPTSDSSCVSNAHRAKRKRISIESEVEQPSTSASLMPDSMPDPVANNFRPMAWESIGALACSSSINTASSNRSIINIDVLNSQDFLVFLPSDVEVLKQEYRIICSGGKTASLMPEQVQILIENGFAKLREICMIQAVAPSTASPTKKRRKMDFGNEEELRQKAAKIAMGKKIKEEKKKVHGADAPSDILKVHKSDEHHFAVAITEDEIVTELEALRQRLKPKADNIYNEEPVLAAPESSYTAIENPSFPCTPDYLKRVTVFRDLWRKGFYLTAGTKFGCDYLAYEKPPGVDHSKFMVICMDSSSDSIKPLDLISISRVSSQVKKNFCWRL